MPVCMLCIDHSLVKGPETLVEGKIHTLGRSSRCDFAVSDLSVSRTHAEIIARKGILLVKDLRSRNGVFIDGVRVKEARAEPGHLLRFGQVRFRVVENELNNECPSNVSELLTRQIHGKSKRRDAILQELSSANLPVLDLLLTPLSRKEIALKLELSPHTVDSHVKEIYRNMNVNSRAALQALFLADPKKPDPPAE